MKIKLPKQKDTHDLCSECGTIKPKELLIYDEDGKNPLCHSCNDEMEYWSDVHDDALGGFPDD